MSEANPNASNTPEQEPTNADLDEPSASAEEPAKPKPRRSNEFWLAALGMAGTLLAAIAGGAATILSGVEHDNHDTESAQVSFTHASQSAQTSFTRAQQVAAYTGYINSARDFTAALVHKGMEDVNRYPYISKVEMLTPNSDREKSAHDFDHAFNEVLLFGGPRVQNAAGNARATAGQFSVFLTDWELGHPATAGTPSCRDVVQFSHTSDDFFVKLETLIDRFNDAAREDLGIPSVPPTSESRQVTSPDDECRALGFAA